MVQLNLETKRLSLTKTVNYEQFIKVHKNQLALIPKIYWRTLYEKITFNIFDLDKNIKLETKQITYSNQVKKQIKVKVCNKNGLSQNDSNNVFLVQHLLHYYAIEGREIMKELINNRDPLLTYLKKLMNVKDANVCTFINNLLDESWKYTIPFSVKNKQKRSLPIWSFTEQVGMAIRHSFDPNFQMVTFQYLNFKRIFSILFPIKNVNFDDEVTRDFTYFEKLNYDQIKLNAQMQLEYLSTFERAIYPSPLNKTNLNWKPNDQFKWTVENEIDLYKRTLLIPWEPDNLLEFFETDINFQQHEPNVIEFFDRRLFNQPYSMIRFEPKNLKSIVALKKQIKVFCNDKQVMRDLNDARFIFVNDQCMADIWWFKNYFYDFAKMYSTNSNILINQFPLSHILNEKDMLATVCRRKLKNFNGNINPYNLCSFPDWLPTTFSLNSELVKFVSYFIKREQRNLDNHWIVKPSNLNNSTDVFITNNLNSIIRMASCSNRIAQKYISNPLLFYRSDNRELVKFELKYFIVLTSVLPLKLFVYKAFQVDFANKKFDLSKSLYNQEMHLTNMNIFEDQNVKRLDIDHIDFINRFNYQFQYTKFDFEKVDHQIMLSIKEMFELSTEKFPFSAINHNTGSSALYQVDIILSWTEKTEPPLAIKPNIIDVNLNPDTDLICSKFPSFYNDVFNLMFLNDEENCNFRYI